MYCLGKPNFWRDHLQYWRMKANSLYLGCIPHLLSLLKGDPNFTWKKERGYRLKACMPWQMITIYILLYQLCQFNPGKTCLCGGNSVSGAILQMCTHYACLTIHRENTPTAKLRFSMETHQIILKGRPAHPRVYLFRWYMIVVFTHLHIFAWSTLSSGPVHSLKRYWPWRAAQHGHWPGPRRNAFLNFCFATINAHRDWTTFIPPR